MLEIGSCEGKSIGVFGDNNKRIGPEIIEDNSLSHIDTIKAIANTKNYIRVLSMENDNLYEKYQDNSLVMPFAFGISIPLLISFILKTTNIDNIYVSSGVDFNNFILHNGNMLTFSDFVTSLSVQASCILTPAAFAYVLKKRSQLMKKMDETNDYITYYQLVLGALRKHAYNLGMKADYELDSKNNKKRVLTPEKNIEK